MSEEETCCYCDCPLENHYGSITTGKVYCSCGICHHGYTEYSSFWCLVPCVKCRHRLGDHQIMEEGFHCPKCSTIAQTDDVWQYIGCIVELDEEGGI